MPVRQPRRAFDSESGLPHFLVLLLVPAHPADETISQRSEVVQKQTRPTLSSLDQRGYGYVCFHQCLVS